MVTTRLPCAADAGSVHERTGSPSRCTVHAPHCAMPQPYFGPLMSSTSRSTQSSGISGSTSRARMRPLMVSLSIYASIREGGMDMKINVEITRLLLCTLALGPVSALAQDYPSKPIRIIVGYSAGGGNDIIVRVMAPELQKGLGQPVLVENKPGAQSIIAAEFVAKAP